LIATLMLSARATLAPDMAAAAATAAVILVTQVIAMPRWRP
jgi:hypothetical protein